MKLAAEPSWKSAIEHRCPKCLRLGSICLGLVLLAFLCTLAGCAPLSALPSMQHCADVKYERHGTAITVEAKCTAPVGGL